jgi:hypothetical protein
MNGNTTTSQNNKNIFLQARKTRNARFFGLATYRKRSLLRVFRFEVKARYHLPQLTAQTRDLIKVKKHNELRSSRKYVMYIKKELSSIESDKCHNTPQVSHPAPVQVTTSLTYAVECHYCQGAGYGLGARHGQRELVKFPCRRCNGAGVLEIPQFVLDAIALSRRIWVLEQELKVAEANVRNRHISNSLGWGVVDTSEADGLVVATEFVLRGAKAELKAITDRRDYGQWRLYVDNGVMSVKRDYNRAQAEKRARAILKAQEQRKIDTYKTSVAQTRLLAKSAKPLLQKRADCTCMPGWASERRDDPTVSASKQDKVVR